MSLPGRRGLLPWAGPLAALLVAPACARLQHGPAGKSATVPFDPDRPPPPPPPPPPPQDHAGFEADFQLAAALVAQDPVRARVHFETLAQSPIESAQKSTAAAAAARLLLREGQAEAARTLLAVVRPTGPDPAHAFVSAVVRARGADAASARAELGRWAEAPPALPGFDATETRLTALAAWAASATAAGHGAETLAAWQRYFEIGGPTEKRFALVRAEAEAARHAPSAALELYQRAPGDLARVALGPRAAQALQAGGRTSEANELAAQSERLRRALFPDPLDAPAPMGQGDPRRLGLAIPLSGNALPLGLAVTRGAMVAIGPPVPGAAAQAVQAYQLVLRDSGSAPAIAARELAEAEAAIGIVGVSDPGAIALATSQGLPYLVLGSTTLPPGSTAFQLVHGTDARVRSLVQAALERGLRRFAIFFADDEDGHATHARFAAELERAKGVLAGSSSYPANATTFSKEVQSLKAFRFDALFVPAPASRLGLIAPALAVADLWPTRAADLVVGTATGEHTRPDPRRPERRPIVLLSTATGLSRELVRRAGRYVQGALLAPGYFPDEGSVGSGSFAATFRELYGREPGASDAFGFDGINVLRACVERGARTRQDVLRILTTDTLPGVTGAIRFGADNQRSDPARVYEITGDAIVAAN